MVVRVDADSLTRTEAGHAVTNRIHGSDELMPGDEGELRREVAVVNMQIGPADPGELDPDAQLPGCGFRGGDIAIGIAARRVVQNGFHVGFPPRRVNEL